mmetsp:Transcript_25193/g.77782  ORF Transcript_25193/g.77782 Transcript_25193/m.77782 type:complete len:265 (-) Transcript_25193:270-1064(-)
MTKPRRLTTCAYDGDSGVTVPLDDDPHGDGRHISTVPSRCSMGTGIPASACISGTTTLVATTWLSPRRRKHGCGCSSRTTRMSPASSISGSSCPFPSNRIASPSREPASTTTSIVHGVTSTPSLHAGTGHLFAPVGTALPRPSHASHCAWRCITMLPICWRTTRTPRPPQVPHLRLRPSAKPVALHWRHLRRRNTLMCFDVPTKTSSRDTSTTTSKSRGFFFRSPPGPPRDAPPAPPKNCAKMSSADIPDPANGLPPGPPGAPG